MRPKAPVRALLRRLRLADSPPASPLPRRPTGDAGPLPEADAAADVLPWTGRYGKLKNALIQAVLGSPRHMALFRDGARLPPRFGLRLDERVVEYPWVLSRLDPEGWICDAGSTLNAEFLLADHRLSARRILVYTLATDWIILDPRISYLFADFAEDVLQPRLFQTIVCISTLEHVGFDYDYKRWSRANPFPAADPDAHLAVMGRFRRLLKPGGQLLLTVPFGRYEDHGWLQQFDHDRVLALDEAFGRPAVERSFYRYRPDGWQVAAPGDCAQDGYFNIHAEAGCDPDHAAAARAVACLAFRA